MRLGLLTEERRVPRACPGLTLTSVEEAQAVQEACKDLVLDAHWNAVVAALQQIQRSECVGMLGRWLSGQAAAYIQMHVRPPYEGIWTIWEWSSGLDTPDRRFHLRRLVTDLGEELAQSARDIPRHVTFAGDEEAWVLRPGAGSAVYVELWRGGRPLPNWLGANGKAVLWFRFAADENERIGLEYYLQARGAHPNTRGGVGETDAWNVASVRHLACAGPFEDLFAAWSGQAPPRSLVAVSTVRFNGMKRNWQGGGVKDPEGPRPTQATPRQALAFIQANRELLWRFPRVGPGEEIATVEEAAPLVRKPACSLLARLDTRDLAAPQHEWPSITGDSDRGAENHHSDVAPPGVRRHTIESG